MMTATVNKTYELTFFEYHHRPRKVHVVEYDGTSEQERSLILEFPGLFSYVLDYEQRPRFYCKWLPSKTFAIGDQILFDLENKVPVLVNIMTKRDLLRRYEPQDKRYDDASDA